MQLNKPATSGTMDSCDISIRIENNTGTENEVFLSSIVEKQYGKQIVALIHEVLKKHQIKGVTVNAVDRGALDCTIKARLESAIYRGLGKEHALDWSVIDHE
ncbi:citrate lyase acyl carrier protein [Fusibacter paucivorans]|uniref:Citrate lyase acyl carrier protein n=1 Tax=Fusibacter paucivorans TaxID=76009 RepID=A0ABS5PL26_9FIRM|nr:citrate lyase acyl carrier protein [Fusibacter paucivorans]MBS7525079.1 citrate lyase acyl carrier protein [Fusibacter paucivorans]